MVTGWLRMWRVQKESNQESCNFKVCRSRAKIELRRQPLTWRSCVEEGNFMMELGDEGGSREGGREQGEMGIVLVTD